MNPLDAYRTRLDCCLDERRDPLDDAELRTLLDQHPELLEHFARTREDLRLLPTLGATAPRPRRRRRAAAIGAIAGVAASVTAWAVLCYSAAEPEPRPPRILSADLVEIAPRLNASTTITVHEPLLRTERIVLETYERRSLTR